VSRANDVRRDPAALLALLVLAASLAGCASESAPAPEGSAAEGVTASSSQALAQADALPGTDAPEPVVAPALHDAVARDGYARAIVAVVDPHPPQVPAGRIDASAPAQPDVGGIAADRQAAVDAVLADLAASGAPLTDVRRYANFALFAADLDAAALDALGKDTRVAGAWPIQVHRPLLESSVPYTGASALHATGNRGAGTSVAVLDTPVLFQNGFFGSCPTPGAAGCRIATWIDFAYSNGGSTDPRIAALARREPHGSNVAGIILGMAPETLVHSINVFVEGVDENGDPIVYTTDELEIAGLDWVATNAASRAIVAVNLSLGSEATGSHCNRSALFSVFANLQGTYGVVPVVASGNDGARNGVSNPGCTTSALTVAASYDRDVGNEVARPQGYYEERGGVPAEIVPFSNVTGMIDLVAPGVWIDAGGLLGYSGTSMATPHVAGAVALYQAQRLVDDGAFATAYVAGRVLSYRSVAAQRDRVFFPQLQLGDEAGWDTGTIFPSTWGTDSSFNIPRGTGVLRQSVNWTMPDTIEALYLPIEVIHTRPQDVEVRLVAPDGTSTTFRLPTTGYAHFNDVIGRRWLPGQLAGFRGRAANGTWQIELRDRGSVGNGRFVSAGLLFGTAPCTPSCEGAAACGDDGCGGTCGGCGSGTFCHPDGECRPNAAWCAGDLQATPRTFAVEHGENSLVIDLAECRSDRDPSCGGDDGRDAFVTLQLPGRSNLRIETAGGDTVLTWLNASGGEMRCHDNRSAGDLTSRIDTNGATGTLALVLDGGTSTMADIVTLSVRVCTDPGCDDGQFCNGEEACSGISCAPGVAPCPAPGLSCVAQCDEERDACGVPRAGFCVIDGVCWPDGSTRPGAPCQVCDADASPLAWVAGDGVPCDDGLFCNGVATCRAGTCVAGSPPCPFRDEDCAEACDEEADTCTTDVALSCDIGGACWPAGAVNPSNPCETCRPSRSTTAWTGSIGGCAVPDAGAPDAGSDAGDDADVGFDAEDDADATSDAEDDADVGFDADEDADATSDAGLDSATDTDAVSDADPDAAVVPDATADAAPDTDTSDAADAVELDTSDAADAVEPDAIEPDAIEPDATEPDAEPDVTGPDADATDDSTEPDATEPDAVATDAGFDVSGGGDAQVELVPDVDARSPAGCAAAEPAAPAGVLLWVTALVVPVVVRRRHLARAVA
jgi:hypothetical protein